LNQLQDTNQKRKGFLIANRKKVVLKKNLF